MDCTVYCINGESVYVVLFCSNSMSCIHRCSYIKGAVVNVGCFLMCSHELWVLGEICVIVFSFILWCAFNEWN